MILKEIAHKVAQAFRLAQATDKKLSTGIAAALETNIKAGAPAEENASSLHGVRTQNRK